MKTNCMRPRAHFGLCLYQFDSFLFLCLVASGYFLCVRSGLNIYFVVTALFCIGNCCT